MRLGAPLPVIFITAYDEPETRGQAEKAGAAAYFIKPFSGHDLITAVARAVDGVVAASAPTGRRD